VSSRDSYTDPVRVKIQTSPMTSEAADLQYLNRASQNQVMEIWKARDQEGRLRQVKILRGLAQKRTLSDKELEQLVHLKHVKHPRLTSVDHIQVDDGQIVIVSPWPDSTLQDRYRNQVALGRVGIDRREMLEYVLIVAEALEFLQKQAQLCHLTLTPASLQYFAGRLRVADFGLAQLAWFPVGQPLAQQMLRYAAPEVFEGTYHANSDQFSMALMYAEMISGHLPYHGNTIKQWREQRRNGEADLHLLSDLEIRILQRALEFEPSRRFSCLAEFVEQLAQYSAATTSLPQTSNIPSEAESVLLLTGQPLPVIPYDEVEAIVHRMLQTIAVKTVVNMDQGIRYLVEGDGTVVHRCAAWLPGGLAFQKLEGFANEWDAIPVELNKKLREYVFQIPMQQRFWERVFHKKAEVIEIRIKLDPPTESHVKQTEVEIRIRYTDSKPTNVRERLEIVVPALLYSIRTFLLAKSETRNTERYRYDGEVYLYPVYVDNLGSPILCQGKDFSLLGMGLLAPEILSSKQCLVQLQTPEFGTVILPGKILRCDPLSNGKFDMGIKFFDHQFL
jgi:serine/threonine protein kinase